VLKSFVAEIADEIFECEDGAFAFDSYAKNKPDLVLMDVEMPKLDGISASRTIKNTFPQAKILIITGFDEPEIREAALAAGASGYFLKENLLPLASCLEEICR
jgi:DNA-binding NarL/FixJ family response regulator